MNVALDTNAYSDFMRGDPDRVQVIRTARHIHIPLIVLGELRAGFARVSVLFLDEQTTQSLRAALPPASQERR